LPEPGIGKTEEKTMTAIFYYTGLLVWLVCGFFSVGYILLEIILAAIKRYYDLAEFIGFVRWQKSSRSDHSKTIEYERHADY